MIPLGVLGAAASSYGGGGEGLWRVVVTIPAQSEPMTGFPVYLNLAEMPAEFWGALAYEDGRDIRAFGSSGRLPLDVVSCSKFSQQGEIFVRCDLSATSSTLITLDFGDPARGAPVPVNDVYGRNAVWADYHRVFMMGDSLEDRTGSGGYAFETLWMPTQVSPNLLDAHQGLCWDGTHYYVVDTNAIHKYDASWNLIASNLDPLSAVGGAANHCGDPEVWEGVIYVPVENYASSSSYSFMHIARFSAADLSPISATNISAQGHEASSIARNPSDGLLYIASYSDGSRLWKYSTSGEFQGEMPLSRSISGIQGITFLDGKLYVTSGYSDTGLWVAGPDGAGVIKATWTPSPSGVIEGLTSVDGELMVLVDGDSGSFAYRGPLLNSFSSLAGHSYTWTMGSTIIPPSTATTQALLSYGEKNVVTNSYRATLGLRSGNELGLWNSTNGWVNASGVVVPEGVPSRVNAVHSQGSYRGVYWNGAETRAAAPANRPVLPSGVLENALFISRRDNSASELFSGEHRFVYLRLQALSAAWIAAESANIVGTGFVEIGDVEPVG